MDVHMVGGCMGAGVVTKSEGVCFIDGGLSFEAFLRRSLMVFFWCCFVSPASMDLNFWENGKAQGVG